MAYDPDLLEKYLDALESLSADDFVSAEAYWTAQSIWSEVVEDHRGTGPFYS